MQMELGIIETQELYRVVQQANRRLEIINTMRVNDPNNVPRGFTAIYLRDYFFHVVPDEFLPDAKNVLNGGFEHLFEERRLNGWIEYGTHFIIASELIAKYSKWSDNHL